MGCVGALEGNRRGLVQGGQSHFCGVLPQKSGQSPSIQRHLAARTIPHYCGNNSGESIHVDPTAHGIRPGTCSCGPTETRASCTRRLPTHNCSRTSLSARVGPCSEPSSPTARRSLSISARTAHGATRRPKPPASGKWFRRERAEDRTIAGIDRTKGRDHDPHGGLLVYRGR